MAKTENSSKEDGIRLHDNETDIPEEASGDLTAEDYRKLAREHQNALKEQWKIFGKVGIFVLATAIALIGLGMAWFANNRDVTGTGMSVEAAPSPFELAADGEKGAYDEKKIESGFATELQESKFKDSDGNELNGYKTSGDKTAVSWAVSSDDNMNNNKSDNVIEPGDSGQMVFYIIPGQDGDLSVKLKLSLEGLVETQDEGIFVSARDSKGTSIQAAQQLLEGHVLLFADKQSQGAYYNDWISKDGYKWTKTIFYSENNTEDVPQATLDFTLADTEPYGYQLSWSGSNLTADIAYPVTIYWIWPEIFGQYIFSETNSQMIGNRPILFPKRGDEEIESSWIRSLFGKMCHYEESTWPYGANRYLMWRQPDGSIDQKGFMDNVTVDLLSAFRNGNGNSASYPTICSYYNKADQFLGETIRYVRLRLDAE